MIIVALGVTRVWTSSERPATAFGVLFVGGGVWCTIIGLRGRRAQVDKVIDDMLSGI